MSWKLASLILQQKLILQKHIPVGKFLLVVLADHCYGDSLSCHPSVERLARLCGTSDRAIYRAVEKLKQAGYLTVQRRQHQPAVFTLHPEKMPNLRPDTSDTWERSRPDTSVNSKPSRPDTGDNPDLTPATLRPDTSVKRLLMGQVSNRLKATGNSFVIPTVAEIAAYIAEMHFGVDAEEIHAYYTANGWMTGRNPMKDWKGAVRYWHRKSFKHGKPSSDLSERNHQARLAYEREHPESA